jgi:nucleoside-diphosphate-sugar epimerase
MRVAITGETGYLAHHLRQHYIGTGHEVVKLTRDYISNLSLVKDCDLLIHCAAVSRAVTEQEVYQANVSIATELAQGLRERGIRVNIKYLSSIQENSNTAYGRAKLEGRRILQEYCNEAKTCFESYALPNTFGPFSKPNHNMFVSTFCHNIVNNLPCNYNTNPIDLCWVGDAIKVVLNEETEYKLHHTSVDQVYNLIKSIHNGNGLDSELAERLAAVYMFFKNNATQILVLGHNGMLGWVVKQYFESQGYRVCTTDSRYPSAQFYEQVLNFQGSYVINCIGAIPQKTKQFDVNEALPIWLSDNIKQCRVIHPGTDCEDDEDDYGQSKRRAAQYLQQHSANTKILKTSIIGPELSTQFSLMDWFLSQQTKVSGYTKAIWNGNTTLEWAKQAQSLVENWDSYNKVTVLRGESISKYNLLVLIGEVFGKQIVIEPVHLGKDKTLSGGVPTKKLREQLLDLKNFLILYKNNKYDV